MADTIKIGWGRRSLAPDYPVPIQGQFNLRVSLGSYTPVYASCLLLESGGDLAAFVSCDMVNVNPDVLLRAQEILKKEIPGFPVEKLIVNATHTHAGPGSNDIGDYPNKVEMTHGAELRAFLGRQIADAVKEGAAEAIRALKAAGIRRTVMLSGDRADAAQSVADELGIDEMHAELLPADKVARLEELLGRGGGTAFVGDGINDAPSLMRSDVGVAMGSLGSDAAIEAADIVLMDDDLRKLAATVRIGRRTVRIVRENVAFALAVKFAVLLLGALGMATMWLAVFGDVGVTVLAVLNAMRCLKSEG